MGLGKEISTGKKMRERASKVKEEAFGDYISHIMDPDSIDWDDIDPSAIATCITKCTRAGVMLTFALTMDGGLPSVSFYHKGEKGKFVLREKEKMEAQLLELENAACKLLEKMGYDKD